MADITITVASVLPSANAVRSWGTAGAAITAGQALYRDTADSNKLKLADANGVSPANDLEGVALHNASAGQPIEYQTGGDITIGGTVVKGTVYVLSATPGGIAPAADLAAGHTVNLIGVAGSTTEIKMRKFSSGVTI